MSGLVQPYNGYAFTSTYQWKHLEPGDLLCRVWNHEDGAAHGFTATDWNPNCKEIADHTAGRFDPIPTTAVGAVPGFLYGSVAGEGEKVALLETLRSVMAREKVYAGQNVIARAERDRRSLAYFKVLEPVSLLDINEQRGRECFRMDEEVLYVHDRPATRTWSDAIKSQVARACGIAYNSTRESVHTNRHSFIMWEDRAPKATFEFVQQVSLGSPEGRELVDNALKDYDILWL